MTRRRKPTIDTRFLIDFERWTESSRNFRVILHSHLCSECQGTFSNYKEAKDIDWIDPDTAAVRRVDGLWQALTSHCRLQSDYISSSTPLSSAIFRVFLANENAPLSPTEVYEILGRKNPDTILRLLSNSEDYRGIRLPPPAE
jgi:hypothetical protein